MLLVFWCWRLGSCGCCVGLLRVLCFFYGAYAEFYELLWEL